MVFLYIVVAFFVYCIFILLFQPSFFKRKVKKIKRKKEIKKQRVREEQEKIVAQRSERIKRIVSLNNKYFFYQIQSNRTKQFSCRSLEALKELDLRDAFIEEIPDLFPEIKKLIGEAEYNERKYQEYLIEYNSIIQSSFPDDKTNYFEIGYFKQIETEMAEQLKKNPVVCPCITAQAEYLSVKQHKTYTKTAIFDLKEIKNCCSIAESIFQIQKDVNNTDFAQNERNLMTNSLRYDILKRDGFKCVLCGASAKDGVKLHVDHIFPVSKGGKTEPENLRTLCERCNRGKGAKYDYNGVN